MKRISSVIYSIYVMLIFMLMLIPSFIPWLIIYKLPIARRDRIVHYLLRFYSNFWCFSTGIIPRIYNRDQIDFGKNYVITANHQSYWDPVQMYTALNTYFKSVGKVEIGKTPLFGLLYRMAVIVVNRQSVSKSAGTYRSMMHYLSQGWSILIFPEATFPDNPQTNLLSFKKGAFSLAIQQSKSILPVLFIDTARRMPPNRLLSFTPGYLTSVFLPAIPCNAFPTENDLRNFTKRYMQHCLDYCRTEDVGQCWEIATNYLQQHIQR